MANKEINEFAQISAPIPANTLFLCQYNGTTYSAALDDMALCSFAMTANTLIHSTVDNQTCAMSGGTVDNITNGAYLKFYGRNHGTYPAQARGEIDGGITITRATLLTALSGGLLGLDPGDCTVPNATIIGLRIGDVNGPTTGYGYGIYVEGVTRAAALANDFYGIRIGDVTGAGNNYGLYIDDMTESPFTSTRYAIYTNIGEVYHGDKVSCVTGALCSAVYGFQSVVSNMGPTGVATAIGADFLGNHYGSAGGAYGMRAKALADGSCGAGTVVGGQFEAAADAGTGHTGVGVSIIGSTTNKFTNAYGLKIDNITSAVTLNYAIYTGAGIVYFSGNVGAATGSSPTAKLHIGAGTAAASTAPLKIESGALLATPEAGAVEWYGGKLYITQASGPTRREITMADMFYGGMYSYENAIATVIPVANTYIGIFEGIGTGTVNGFTFAAGVSGAIASVADYSGTVPGTIKVTVSAGHNLETGDYITQANTTNYDGVYLATKISATEYYVTKAYVSTRTGLYVRGARLRANAGSAGVYMAHFCCSGDTASDDKLIKMELNNNLTPLDNIAGQRQYAKGLDYGQIAGCGLVTIADGDDIWPSLKNKTDATNYTPYMFNMTIGRR